MQLNYEKLGKKIRIARKNMDLTQEKLAEQLGLSSSYISDIERGAGKTSLETLVKICNSLDVTADMLLLDSIYSSNEYVKDDIAKKLNKCSNKSLKLVLDLIDAVVENQLDD